MLATGFVGVLVAAGRGGEPQPESRCLLIRAMGTWVSHTGHATTVLAMSRRHCLADSFPQQARTLTQPSEGADFYFIIFIIFIIIFA